MVSSPYMSATIASFIILAAVVVISAGMSVVAAMQVQARLKERRRSQQTIQSLFTLRETSTNKAWPLTRYFSRCDAVILLRGSAMVTCILTCVGCLLICTTTLIRLDPSWLMAQGGGFWSFSVAPIPTQPTWAACSLTQRLGAAFYPTVKASAYLFFFVKQRMVRVLTPLSYIDKALLINTMLILPLDVLVALTSGGDASVGDTSCTFKGEGFIAAILLLVDLELNIWYLVRFLSPLVRMMRERSKMDVAYGRRSNTTAASTSLLVKKDAPKDATDAPSNPAVELATLPRQKSQPRHSTPLKVHDSDGLPDVSEVVISSPTPNPNPSPDSPTLVGHDSHLSSPMLATNVNTSSPSQIPPRARRLDFDQTNKEQDTSDEVGRGKTESNGSVEAIEINIEDPPADGDRPIPPSASSASSASSSSSSATASDGTDATTAQPTSLPIMNSSSTQGHEQELPAAVAEVTITSGISPSHPCPASAPDAPSSPSALLKTEVSSDGVSCHEAANGVCSPASSSPSPSPSPSTSPAAGAVMQMPNDMPIPIPIPLADSDQQTNATPSHDQVGGQTANEPTKEGSSGVLHPTQQAQSPTSSNDANVASPSTPSPCPSNAAQPATTHPTTVSVHTPGTSSHMKPKLKGQFSLSRPVNVNSPIHAAGPTHTRTASTSTSVLNRPKSSKSTSLSSSSSSSSSRLSSSRRFSTLLWRSSLASISAIIVSVCSLLFLAQTSLHDGAYQQLKLCPAVAGFDALWTCTVLIFVIYQPNR